MKTSLFVKLMAIGKNGKLESLFLRAESSFCLVKTCGKFNQLFYLGEKVMEKTNVSRVGCIGFYGDHKHSDGNK